MGAQFPTLDAGVTFLDDRDAPAALYRLVGDHLAGTEGPAYWLDARNAAVPGVIRRHAVGRTAATLRVARAFTGYQHYELVRGLPQRVSPRTTLVVAPNLDALYAEDDVPDQEAETMLEATLAILKELADAVDCPVLVTAESDSERVRAAADRTLDATETRAGLRVDGPAFGTDVYWGPWGYQTTIPYWVELLGTADGARAAEEPLIAETAIPGV
ncbi:hypothetical protein [Halorhabdus amylolytica]|uniref:hypothetical protein n=1 Tax=Halorhabdus amylolytica TaxID=2559573 RepID=UPI0010AA3F0F|nr:hypothetical protein [Halorhabdus amylolytica]